MHHPIDTSAVPQIPEGSSLTRPLPASVPRVAASLWRERVAAAIAAGGVIAITYLYWSA